MDLYSWPFSFFLQYYQEDQMWKPTNQKWDLDTTVWSDLFLIKELIYQCWGKILWHENQTYFFIVVIQLQSRTFGYRKHSAAVQSLLKMEDLDGGFWLPYFLSTFNKLEFLSQSKEFRLEAIKLRNLDIKKLAYNIDIWTICIT